jgi:HK97 family phage prohead protease
MLAELFSKGLIMPIQGIIYNNSYELRSNNDQGIVEAYITKWDTVDSYDSTFIRGAFKQTFKKRVPKKVRLLWNHNELAGKVLDAREDEIGAWVKVKFNLDTEVGKRAFSHIQHGDIDSFSFGFIPIKDKYNKTGIRQIQKVELFEVSPVVFEANEKANIVNIRSLKDMWQETSQKSLKDIWLEKI